LPCDFRRGGLKPLQLLLGELDLKRGSDRRRLRGRARFLNRHARFRERGFEV